MDYLIATIVIMLFCITALAQERHPDSTILLSRPKPKLVKHHKTRSKPVVKCNSLVPDIITRQGMDAGINPGFLSGRQYGGGLMPVYAKSNGSFYAQPVIYTPKQRFIYTATQVIRNWRLKAKCEI